MSAALSNNENTVYVISNRGLLFSLFDNANYTSRLQELELNKYVAWSCILNFLFKINKEVRYSSSR